MSIRTAFLSDLETVKTITHTTISEIYPHYYSGGAVEFFLEHHSADNIINDIESNCVFICMDSNQNAVGTVTIKNNEILRLFVLPQYQGKGFGSELLEYAENAVSINYSEIKIDASLSAKAIYLKRGYKETEYHIIKTRNNDFLCYDVMTRKI